MHKLTNVRVTAASDAGAEAKKQPIVQLLKCGTLPLLTDICIKWEADLSEHLWERTESKRTESVAKPAKTYLKSQKILEVWVDRDMMIGITPVHTGSE